MSEERTLVLIKPDGVARGLMGEVFSRLERKGYKITSLLMTEATEEQLRRHYAEKVNAPDFPEILEYMTSGPLVAMVVTGTNIVKNFRAMAGVTNPSEAAPGTIRGDYGRDWEDGAVRNIVHSSDSVENAEREISIWFENH